MNQTEAKILTDIKQFLLDISTYGTQHPALYDYKGDESQVAYGLKEKLEPVIANINPYWRNSRFDYNAVYMSWADFQREYPTLAFLLKGKRSHNPVFSFGYAYYRRGTGGLQVYRVAKEDYKMPRERKNHKIITDKNSGSRDACKPSSSSHGDSPRAGEVGTRAEGNGTSQTVVDEEGKP